MGLRLPTLVTLLIVLSVTGCATQSVGLRRPEPRPLGAELPSFHPPRDASSEAPGPDETPHPTGTITLRQALSLALQSNPDLAASAWELMAAEARTRQAGLPPNPTLEFEAEGFGGQAEASGFEAATFTLSLGQMLELGGKRSKRAGIARLEQQLSGWDYETKRLDVFAETAKAFVSLLAAQERARLAADAVHLAEAVHRTVAERVKAGKAAALEQTMTEVGVATSQIDLKRAQSALQAARKRLSAAWGSDLPTFDQGEGPFDAVLPEIPPLSDLLAIADQNPDLARWDTEIQLCQAAVALEKAARVPDLGISAGIARSEESSQSTYKAAMSLPLPLFDRNQGNVAEAEYNLSRARQQRRSVALEVEVSLSEAHQTLQSAGEELEILRNQVLPAARQAFDAANEGYRRGKFGYLEVLDARRALLDARAQYIGALARHHEALTDVERLIGAPLDGMTQD